KVNPPLRTAADVAALRAALADGTIDCVATDHAPHPLEDKETEWAAAAFGMTGLETVLRVVQEAMVETGLLDWAGVAARMSARPAPPRSGGGPATGSHWPPGRRPASPCTTPNHGRRSTQPRTRPGAATRRSRAGYCRGGWWPRSCAAAPPSSTGS